MTTLASLASALQLASIQGLIALAYAAVFFALGVPLVRWARLELPAERFAITTGAGLATFLVGCQVLCAVRLFTLPALALVPAIAVWRARTELLSLWRAALVDRWNLLGAAALLLPILLLALYPPTAWDDLLYHLPLAELHASTRGLGYEPEIRYSHFPQSFEILLASALLVGSALPQIVTFVMVVITAATIGGIASRFIGSHTWFAVGLWLSSPIVMRLGSICYVESALACAATLYVYASLRWLESANHRWLSLAALFAGTAAAIKVSGLVFVVLLVPLVASSSRPGRRLVTVGAIVAATCGLYYVRALWLAGNPLYPLLQELSPFASGPWDAADIASHDSSLRSFGVARSFPNLLALPWYLTFAPALFASDLGVGVWFLLAVPGVVAVALLHPGLRWVTVVTAGYLAIWFSTYQEYRGVVPILPLAAIATAALVHDVTARSPWPLASWAQVVVRTAVLLFILSPGWLFVRNELMERGLPPTSSGERTQFVEARVPGAEAVRIVRESSAGKYRLFALFGETLRYEGRGRVCGDWFGPCRFREVVDRLGSTTSLWQYLHANGFTHVLLDRRRFAEVQNAPLDLPADFRERFDAVYDRRSIVVYALRAPTT